MKISELKQKNLLRYDTDKFGKCTWETGHSYANFYDDEFLPLKNKSLKILEIGVQMGGSHRLIHDYFSNSEIYGVDIRPKWNGESPDNFKRLNLYYFDAYDLGKFNLSFKDKKFDIIIDDGPHTLESQIIAINNFTDFLSPNGVLIIEDVKTRNLEELKNKSNKEFKIIDFSKQSKRHDDILIIWRND